MLRVLTILAMALVSILGSDFVLGFLLRRRCESMHKRARAASKIEKEKLEYLRRGFQVLDEDQQFHIVEVIRQKALPPPKQ